MAYFDYGPKLPFSQKVTKPLCRTPIQARSRFWFCIRILGRPLEFGFPFCHSGFPFRHSGESRNPGSCEENRPQALSSPCLFPLNIRLKDASHHNWPVFQIICLCLHFFPSNIRCRGLRLPGHSMFVFYIMSILSMKVFFAQSGKFNSHSHTSIIFNE